MDRRAVAPTRSHQATPPRPLRHAGAPAWPRVAGATRASGPVVPGWPRRSPRSRCPALLRAPTRTRRCHKSSCRRARSNPGESPRSATSRAAPAIPPIPADGDRRWPSPPAAHRNGNSKRNSTGQGNGAAGTSFFGTSKRCTADQGPLTPSDRTTWVRTNSMPG